VVVGSWWVEVGILPPVGRSAGDRDRPLLESVAGLLGQVVQLVEPERLAHLVAGEVMDGSGVDEAPDHSE
jgi:hypothetical protein